MITGLSLFIFFHFELLFLNPFPCLFRSSDRLHDVPHPANHSHRPAGVLLRHHSGDPISRRPQTALRSELQGRRPTRLAADCLQPGRRQLGHAPSPDHLWHWSRGRGELYRWWLPPILVPSSCPGRHFLRPRRHAEQWTGAGAGAGGRPAGADYVI